MDFKAPQHVIDRLCKINHPLYAINFICENDEIKSPCKEEPVHIFDFKEEDKSYMQRVVEFGFVSQVDYIELQGYKFDEFGNAKIITILFDNILYDIKAEQKDRLLAMTDKQDMQTFLDLNAIDQKRYDSTPHPFHEYKIETDMKIEKIFI